MDAGRTNVTVGSAGAAGTRGFGRSLATRSLGIALAIWPGTLFGIDTGLLLLVVVAAIGLILILAVWRRRRSDQETEREENPRLPHP